MQQHEPTFDVTSDEELHFPERWSEPRSRVHVDSSSDSLFSEILRIGVFAADDWTFGPEGPYKKQSQTPADTTRGQIHEALLHLLELGFIEINEERLKASQAKDTWLPVSTSSVRFKK